MSGLACSNNCLFKCCLLNIRSHQDYVCLEIDNYKNARSSLNKRCLDSSQVIIPVFDKIRFNIKTAEPTTPFWFEDKLEVFVEGCQLYPKRYCAGCDRTRRRQSIETMECSTNTEVATEDSGIQRFISDALEKPSEKVEFNFDSNSVISKETSSTSFVDYPQNCKSEMIILDCDDYTNYGQSISACDLFVKDKNEKSIQTDITLGNCNISEDSSSEGRSDISIESLFSGRETRLLNPIKSKNRMDDNYTFIYRMCNEVDAFDTLKRVKYWTLIDTARRMLKMNREVLELNALLKNSTDNLKCSESIRALSPVELVSNFKKSNGSSFYNFPKDICNDRTWENLTVKRDFFKSKYFERLNKTFSVPLSDKENISNCGEDLKNGSGLESLGLLQRRMLKLMEHFIRRSDLN